MKHLYYYGPGQLRRAYRRYLLLSVLGLTLAIGCLVWGAYAYLCQCGGWLAVAGLGFAFCAVSAIEKISKALLARRLLKQGNDWRRALLDRVFL